MSKRKLAKLAAESKNESPTPDVSAIKPPTATILVPKMKAATTESEKVKPGEVGAPVFANGAPLFAIDTKPTKIDLASIQPPEEEPVPVVDTSKMNRQARRRLKLIDQAKDKIYKDLVKKGEPPVGSAEFQSELKRLTDVWTRTRDEKQLERAEKRKARKEKNRQKLRNKYGKVLTGRRLTERKKEIAREDKSRARKQRKLAALDD